MEVQTFASHEEMVAALEEHQRHAMEGLHPVQRRLKFGDHWVRFVDTSTEPAIVEFGRILTPEEIATSMLDDGIEWSEVKLFIEMTESKLEEQGLMWGVASSLLNGGMLEVGQTHKAEVWPIDKSLYEAAQAHGFDISKFEENWRIHLGLAFQLHRAHVLPDKYEAPTTGTEGAK